MQKTEGICGGRLQNQTYIQESPIRYLRLKVLREQYIGSFYISVDNSSLTTLMKI